MSPNGCVDWPGPRCRARPRPIGGRRIAVPELRPESRAMPRPMRGNPLPRSLPCRKRSRQVRFRPIRRTRLWPNLLHHGLIHPVQAPGLRPVASRPAGNPSRRNPGPPRHPSLARRIPAHRTRARRTRARRTRARRTRARRTRARRIPARRILAHRTPAHRIRAVRRSNPALALVRPSRVRPVRPARHRRVRRRDPPGSGRLRPSRPVPCRSRHPVHARSLRITSSRKPDFPTGRAARMSRVRNRTRPKPRNRSG
jgi:hypothetical protein